MADPYPPELEHCRACPRLAEHREAIAAGRIMRRNAYQDEPYWGKPIPGFGDRGARIMLLGLAPGAHGSNRTGRMFTGDSSGRFLYAALHGAGLANLPESAHRNDDLRLSDVWITAACRCVPPGNKPTRAEIDTCRHWLEHDFRLLAHLRVVVALGRVAHDAYLELLNSRGRRVIKSEYPFSHGALHDIGSAFTLLDSYHVSFQNTNTGKLTAEMFAGILERAKAIAAGQ